MITVDQLLLKIVNFTAPTIEEIMPSRDSKVLRSLATTILGPRFITENQSRLLLKIFKEHQPKFKEFQEELELVLEAPTWSKLFRPVDTTKKLYISNASDGTPLLTIEFAFSSALRKTLTASTKKLDGLIQVTPGRVYQADLTEKNIVSLVEMLSPLAFEIEEKIQEFHETIKSWSENEIKNQFLLTTITNTNFQKQITADLGINTPLDNNIINDRSKRYNYFTEKSEKNPENLTEKIAQRSNVKCWVNKKEITLDQLIQSVSELKRFPLLVVFDVYDPKKCLEEMKNLEVSLENNRIYNDVGIYFRLDNNPIGKEFNQLIADKGYNAQLDSNTKVVGVQSGKIPKFLLKTDWKPMSVISIGNPLRHSKTAVYANCCDLIIAYTDNEPIIETRNEWL